jgi:hypothetical protein
MECPSHALRCVLRTPLLGLSIFIVALGTMPRIGQADEPSSPDVLVVLGASGEVDYGEQFLAWGNLGFVSKPMSNNCPNCFLIETERLRTTVLHFRNKA